MMQPENRDDELRKLFIALREAERRLTPPFSRIWRKAQAMRERSHWPLRTWAPAAVVAAGVATVAVIAVIYLALPPGQQTVESTSLAQWRSPTASLLGYPGQEFYQGSWQPTRSLVPDGRNGSS